MKFKVGDKVYIDNLYIKTEGIYINSFGYIIRTDFIRKNLFSIGITTTKDDIKRYFFINNVQPEYGEVLTMQELRMNKINKIKERIL